MVRCNAPGSPNAVITAAALRWNCSSGSSPIIEVRQKRPNLVSAAAVEKINIGVISADDLCQQFSHCPLRAWCWQRPVLSTDVGEPPLELRPRAVALCHVIHAGEL
jgi:hypothetical protein